LFGKEILPNLSEYFFSLFLVDLTPLTLNSTQLKIFQLYSIFFNPINKKNLKIKKIKIYIYLGLVARPSLRVSGWSSHPYLGFRGRSATPDWVSRVAQPPPAPWGWPGVVQNNSLGWKVSRNESM
jgi:hypothetical protein